MTIKNDKSNFNDAALRDFGKICLHELLASELEPDAQWQEQMLTQAERLGLIRIRPVRPGDDVGDEYDFMWELI